MTDICNELELELEEREIGRRPSKQQQLQLLIKKMSVPVQLVIHMVCTALVTCQKKLRQPALLTADVILAYLRVRASPNAVHDSLSTPKETMLRSEIKCLPEKEAVVTKVLTGEVRFLQPAGPKSLEPLELARKWKQWKKTQYDLRVTEWNDKFKGVVSKIARSRKSIDATKVERRRCAHRATLKLLYLIHKRMITDATLLEHLGERLKPAYLTLKLPVNLSTMDKTLKFGAEDAPIVYLLYTQIVTSPTLLKPIFESDARRKLFEALETAFNSMWGSELKNFYEVPGAVENVDIDIKTFADIIIRPPTDPSDSTAAGAGARCAATPRLMAIDLRPAGPSCAAGAREAAAAATQIVDTTDDDQLNALIIQTAHDDFCKCKAALDSCRP